MKALIFVLAFAFIQLAGMAQSKNVKTTEFKVFGNCGMCEKRIEKALNVEGVESAKWDSKTELVKVTYNSDKISEEKLHQLIAGAGHDTEKMHATDEAYNKLDACCQYDRTEKSGENNHHHSDGNHKH
jgi:periplasmic mercuric ion binding protein